MREMMCMISVRQCMAGLLAGVVCLLASGVAQAQTSNLSTDTTPPVIELEELAKVLANTSQVFTVQIAEETKLDEATLYYRRSGEPTYTAAPMRPLGTSGFYTVSIATDPTDLLTIEYYVQAIDAAGNRTVSGFAFDPYQRTLEPSPVAQKAPEVIEDVNNPSEPTQIETRQPFYKRRWFQVTAGVVAVGIIASTIGSDEEDTQNVPVTITLE